MSVQFGRWSFNDLPAAPDHLEKAAGMLAPYGPDGEGRYSGPGVDIIYRAFHTTREARREQQPQQLPSGAVLTWDGRLDNREELIGQLRGQVTLESADVAIAAAAYEQWGTNSFAKLIGDWALSIWEPRERALILAKDFLGSRHLYYIADQEQVTWSTILDPLVLLANKSFELEEEYIAGWLSLFPAAYLTPYVGIHAVPPSTFVRLRPGKETVTKYWDFDPRKQICYATDGEYEEHFRTVFRESVRRRLRSDAPVLAELSGGMDSSSIVCMADTILSQANAEAPRLDTISYYDDSEPNWNERPYFSRVEEKRGRRGCHIDVSGCTSSELDSNGNLFAATPGSCFGLTETGRHFGTCVTKQGNRVLLSGIGGDEVTGGVPTPIPSLMDALGRAQVHTLAQQLKVWALDKRRPWFHLLWEAASGFFPPSLVGVTKPLRPVPWLFPTFLRRHREALTGYPARISLFGALPTFQENMATLEALRRQIECQGLPFAPPYEKRHPYLDRDMVEFLYAIPREQLVRPGQRRSLMRRALRDIVPSEILHRRRKAYVARSSLMIVFSEWAELVGRRPQMLSALFGIVDSKALGTVIEQARRGEEVHIVALMRTLQVESWFRTIAGRILPPRETSVEPRPARLLSNTTVLSPVFHETGERHK
jgi:asparagine synthase (glutamine-hydrolysing)